jgi:hypothetical protein
MSTFLIEGVRHLDPEEEPPVFAEVEKTIVKVQQRASDLFGHHVSFPVWIGTVGSTSSGSHRPSF